LDGIVLNIWEQKTSTKGVGSSPSALTINPNIWTALNGAADKGIISESLAVSLSNKFGETALHLGTRHQLMRLAIRDLQTGMTTLCDLIPLEIGLDTLANPRVIGGDQLFSARDRLLLAIDSFLYEFRAFLELMAEFAYGMLSGRGIQPGRKVKLST
jgi:hypothetical protein